MLDTLADIYVPHFAVIFSLFIELGGGGGGGLEGVSIT